MSCETTDKSSSLSEYEVPSFDQKDSSAIANIYVP